MDSDEPVEEGEVGRLVITDLFNYAFPMIRYDTGDLGIMANHDSEWSTVRDVYGRRRDVILIQKENLFHLLQYQFICGKLEV